MRSDAPAFDCTYSSNERAANVPIPRDHDGLVETMCHASLAGIEECSVNRKEIDMNDWIDMECRCSADCQAVPSRYQKDVTNDDIKPILLHFSS